jgi:hypothetical protein
MKDAVQSCIERMTLEDFVGFQRELQYAGKWHHLHYEAADRSCRLNDGEHSGSTGAIRGVVHHPRKRDAIVKSELYNIARAEISKRVRQRLPDLWCGWINFDSEDTAAVVDAINIIARKQYPVVGALGELPSSRQIRQAQETLERYGLTGVFIDSEDLIQTFVENYMQ